jgi:hypothetical protein
MPSYLDILPEDILQYIYRMLYKSVINDMKKDAKYRNLEWFNKLLELSKNPYVDNLNYSDFLVSSCIDNIVLKYVGYLKRNSYNSLIYDTSLYYKSYYIEPLDININKIEIFNYYINDLYKDDEEGLELFNNTYFITSYYSGTTKGINKNGFILEKEGSFRCLAEVLFYTINFYDFVKQILYMNIDMIEQIGMVLNLSSIKIRERDNLIDILNYHISHRYLEGILYNIRNKCAKPLLE